MKILKQIVIGTCSASFVIVMIGFITPGWLIIDADNQKMNELRLKSLSSEAQKKYKERYSHPDDIQSIRVTFGPFYLRYCLRIMIGTVPSDICAIMSSGNAIDTMETTMRNNNSGLQEFEEQVHEKGINFSIESMINMCKAVVVVCSLAFIQSFVSLGLTIVYSCKRYPPKRLGIVGSVFLILSGTTTSIFLIIYLIINGQYMKVIRSAQIKDALDLGLPYSPVLCMFGSIMYFACAGILMYLTLKSRGQHSYEMMVIDTSTGGSTYIAKT